MIKLSRLNSRALKQILAAYDKVFQSQAQKQAIKLEEVLKDLKQKGLFSMIVGSRISEHSRIEFFADPGKKDPTVDIDFIPNLATFPDGDLFRRIKQMSTRFKDELKTIAGKDSRGGRREGQPRSGGSGRSGGRSRRRNPKRRRKRTGDSDE